MQDGDESINEYNEPEFEPGAPVFNYEPLSIIPLEKPQERNLIIIGG